MKKVAENIASSRAAMGKCDITYQITYESISTSFRNKTAL